MNRPAPLSGQRRRLGGRRLVIASHNAGKVLEMADLLAPFGLETVSAEALGLAEPDETGTSFAANARLKALAAAAAGGLPALADDSGLTVDALGGAPGVHSARWAGRERDFAAAMARVERELQAAGAVQPAQRRARFVCALVLAWPDGYSETFEGTVEGRLVSPPRGRRGFGYDPMFLPDGAALTFGEMAPAEKHKISHRARAFRKLAEDCLT